MVRRDYFRNEQNAKGRVWHETASSGHVETTLQLVLSGQFLGIIPDHIAARWVANGSIKPVAISSLQASTSVYLVYRKR